ncbi:MAG: NAD(P)H-binding protein [Schleiferiaceae bacterium]|nr:NAD(P)H-binding protein [Schleiferiaceae bacterium]
MKNHQATVLGATGATGQEIVSLLLKDDAYSKVSIFVRSKPNIQHNKLMVHEVDFSKLNNYKDLINGDILFSALGTTRKEAGSLKQQYLVDYTYQYEFAQMASDNGVTHYSLVSSTGANEKSFFFYPKVKGSLEESVKKLKFKKIQIFQPPMLIRQAELMRVPEKNGIKFLKGLNKIGLLKSQKPLSVSLLAKKMIIESKSEKSVQLKTYQLKDIL